MKTVKLGNREFDTSARTYVMGILNCTPDSFYPGSRCSMDNVLFRVEEMISQGVDIIDLGGQSTRPGFTEVSEEEEMERVVPVLHKLHARFDMVWSVDTYRSEVARESLRAGAHMINDISGLQLDETMGRVIAENNCKYCLMHNRLNSVYQDFSEEYHNDINVMLQKAQYLGIKKEQIILDPGLGFAKNREQNLKVLQEIERIKNYGYPILVGASRKSFIGDTLHVKVEDRLYGTLAVTALAVMKGCAFVRVHDVRANREVIDMLYAIEHADLSQAKTECEEV